MSEPTRPADSESQPLVRIDIVDGVATLTLDSPRNRNALGDALRIELQDALADVQQDRTVRALVLTGAGEQFCSGGDVRAMATIQYTPEGRRERMHELHDLLRTLLRFDRPVIAAVDGAAYGAGFSLALAADMIIATPRARFCMSFIRIGLIPDYGALHTLPRFVGMQRAKELMLSGREVGADEARQIGLAMELHEPEALLPRAQQIAASFVDASPTAVSLIKRALGGSASELESLLELEATGQGVAGASVAHKEAVERFLAKQPARFRWPG